MRNALKFFLKFSNTILPYAVIVVCAVLIWQNIQLRKHINDLTGKIKTLNALDAPALGSHFPFLSGIDEAGVRKELVNNNLILFYSPTCPHCTAVLPVWRRLSEKLHTSQVTVLAVTGTMNMNSLKAMQLPVSAHLILIDQKDLLSYHLHGTPTTFLIDKLGVVKAVSAGEMDSSDEANFIKASKN